VNDSAQAVVEEVSRAEQARCSAIGSSDWSALGNLLAEEFTYTHSSGRTEDKTTQLTRLQEFDRAVERLSIRVRTYGAVAVTNGELVFHLPAVNGKPATDPRVDVMQVWVKRDGRWQLAAHHSIRL
jgi:Domain of unknown function (DUF4440)